MDQKMGNRNRENPVGSRGWTSMNNRTGEGHMDPLEEGAVHQAIPQGTINHGAQIRGSSTGNRQTSNERPTQDTHAIGRCDSRNRSHASHGRNNHNNLERRENP